MAFSASPTIRASSENRMSPSPRPSPQEMLPKGWIKIPPDLAVEVVSPNDSSDQLEEKLADYEKVGIPLIWVIISSLAR